MLVNLQVKDFKKGIYNMDIKLSEKLQLLRKEKGLTQEELANVFNVTNQSVSKWENGLACPDISLLPEIAEYFKVSIDELLGYKPSSSINSLYLGIDSLFSGASEKEKSEYVYKLSKFASIAMWNNIDSVKRDENRMLDGKDVNSSSIGITNNGCSIYSFNSCFVSFFEEYPKFENKTVRVIHNFIKSISDFDTLKVLFKLHELSIDNFSGKFSVEEIAEGLNINLDKVTEIINKLIMLEIINEAEDNFKLEKIHIVPMLVTMMTGLVDFDKICRRK